MARGFTFKKGFSPDIILGRIRPTRVVGSDGKVTLSHATLSDDWEAVLTSALEKPPGISDIAFRSAIQKAIFSNRLAPDFTEVELQAECARCLGSLAARPRQKFRLFFEISLAPQKPTAWLTSGGCRLYFSPSESATFMLAAREAREQLWKSTFPSRAQARPGIADPMAVIAHVEAASTLEARQVAIDAVDEIRGLINFVVNERRLSQQSFGPRKPINLVRHTTLQTIHSEDGSLASSQFWYERDWHDTQVPSLTNDDRPLIRRFRNALRKLRNPRNQLSSIASVALRQYARALDDDSWKNAFLELWIVLEYLVGIQNAEYDRLVSRSSGMFTEHSEMREIAQHLRVRRNEFVHASGQEADAEQLIFQLKRLIEPLLIFVLANPFHIRTIEELRAFLDLPKDRDVLRQRGSLINQAIYFRRPARSRK